MPQSSESSPDRGPERGIPGLAGRPGPHPVRSASGESILIPPARTPPDDCPEDYPVEPPPPPPPSCAAPARHPYALGFAAFARRSELAVPALLPVLNRRTRLAPAPRPVPGPATAGPLTAGNPVAGRLVAGPTVTGLRAPAQRSRRRRGYAGATMMTAMLAEGQIMEVSDVLAASPVDLALERAEDLLDDLLCAHERTPPAHILAQTVRLRRGLERLARRSVPGGDARRRDLLIGRVAVLGADAAFKLGDTVTARSLTTLGFQVGQALGDAALCGSAREVAAVAEFYAGRPEEALRLARDGLTRVDDGPVHVRLVCQVARALAALGDVRGAALSLDEAYDLADLVPPDQWGRPGPSFETCHPVLVPYHATTAMCLLGRPTAAEQHAELALPGLDALEVPGFRSVIRLDLAIALSRQGRLELDRVCTLASEAIEISWGRTVASVSIRADQLLTATRAHSEVRAVRRVALLVREWQRSAANQRPAPGAVTAPGHR
ncbi:hypothetical protein MXD61_02355 [Frankia sp. AgPm24]|uniref:hypothetical protein n=1 Tax=Frankia sp. AgPm24 TaxID=631128 RepID=UPI00200E5A46|nr:hypothetical protein [Frankia sp. AgPm24]MCK9920758.1 hypothetical protein [Frankia sp. AgPm24]